MEHSHETKESGKQQFEKFMAQYGVPASIFAGLGLIAISIYLSFGMPNKTLTGASPSPAPAAPATRVEASADDDPFLGKADAPVTVIEFSDFQCPFCRKFWQDTFAQIKTEYIDTGKVRFVYRDYPLSNIHTAAQVSAEAGECADDQGKFWAMHDKIFEEQAKQGTGTIQYDEADLKKWGREIGLNTADFNKCLTDHKYQAEVEKDFADGGSYGVTGTPAFFINGVLLKGAMPFSAFKTAIEAELNGK